DVQSLAARQPLEHLTRHAETPLARLIRIGRGADDDLSGRGPRGSGGSKVALQIALERAQQTLLDEDVPLKVAELRAGEPARAVRLTGAVQPHRAQPHCTHTRQPDCRTVPAPQSGQGGGAGAGAASVFVRVMNRQYHRPTCLRQEAGAVSLSRWKASG